MASALRHIEVLEREGFHAIKISLKASDVVWSQQGTSMTSEWLGKAYACK